MSNKKNDKTDASSKKSKASKGGDARAAAMSPEERKRIAAQAAAERWAKTKGLPRETHPGTIQLGELKIPCAILSTSDGAVMRVIPRAGLRSALDVRSRSSSSGSSDDANIPGFLAGPTIAPFLSTELREMFLGSIAYRPKNIKNTGVGYAYPAEILALVCEAVIDAKNANSLQPSQAPVAAAATILYKALARVGIVALIDEATGYQEERDREELQRILSAYIAPELQKWFRLFPHEFFKQLHRLWHWRYTENSTQGPGHAGTLINEYIYKRLPPGVHEELQRLNPKVDGKRKAKNWQRLTKHTGIPHLDNQILAVTTLMAVSEDKGEFETLLKRRFPVSGDQGVLPFPRRKPDKENG